MRSGAVIITGASSGIGAATARRLADEHRLVLVARRREKLAELTTWIQGMGGQVHGVVADVAEQGAAETIVEETLARFGGIGALINNAGIFRTRPTAEIDPDHIDEQIRVNLRAPILLTGAALPHLLESKDGWIINVSSVTVESAFVHCGVYAATKAGLEAWSRSLREELRMHRVRVGIVAPGATDSEIWPEGEVDRSQMCRADDVARAIAYMLDSPPTATTDRMVVKPPW